MSVALFPTAHLLSSTRAIARRRSQYIVHVAFRTFILVMNQLGVLTYEISNQHKLQGLKGKLIVANHPSLIDVVFVISMLPSTYCVVKKAAWSNPFMAGVMWATGYIPNDDPQRLIKESVDCLARGDNLVMFPESTRTVPGQPIKLKRGAANILDRSSQSFVPIAITCEPTTLTKSEKWYQIPHKRVHFRITIGDPIDPANHIALDQSSTITRRKIDQLLKTVLVEGMKRHARHD